MYVYFIMLLLERSRLSEFVHLLDDINLSGSLKAVLKLCQEMEHNNYNN